MKIRWKCCCKTAIKIVLSTLIGSYSQGVYSEPDPASTTQDDGLRPLPLLNPALSLQVKDSAKLYKFFAKNDWIKNFRKTNLYRGMIEELGPFYFILGQNFNNAWSGRLIDFLMENLLVSDPVILQYYTYNNLISPFSFLIPQKADDKMQVASLLLKKSARESITQKMYSVDEKKEINSFSVTPLKIHSHRFAMASKEKCAALAKDPRIAVSSSANCEKFATFDDDLDAKITINLREFFPHLSIFVERFLKYSQFVDVMFKYQAWDNYYRPVSVNWKNVAEVQVPDPGPMSEIISFIPAKTMFFTTQVIPWPQKFSQQEISNFLNLTPYSQDTVYRSVTLVAWKKAQSLKGTSHVTAVIVLDPKSEIDLAEIPQIFSLKTPAEIKFDRICSKYVVVTPYVEVLSELHDTCDQKKPVLSHRAPRFSAEAVAADSLRGLLYFDLGTFLLDAFHLGIERLKEKTSDTPEVVETLKLLEDVPSFAYLGFVKNKALHFVEVP